MIATLSSLFLFFFTIITTGIHAQEAPVSENIQNPWKPNRNVQPSSNPDGKGSPAATNNAYEGYHFAVRDFLIAMGVVFLVIGALVGLLIAYRAFKAKKQGRNYFDEGFEREVASLARRANSMRDPARGAAGMRGDMAPMSKANSTEPAF